MQQLASTPGDIEERREQARQIVDDACKGKHVSRACSLATVLPSVIDTAEQGQAKALPRHGPTLDQLTTVLGPGRPVVVGARPGVGKSLLLTNLALHGWAARARGDDRQHGDAEVEVGQRLLRPTPELTSARSHRARWTRSVGADRVEARRPWVAMPITIDDAPNQTVTSIRRAARDIQRTREDLALIAVDYLQPMGTASRTTAPKHSARSPRGSNCWPVRPAPAWWQRRRSTGSPPTAPDDVPTVGFCASPGRLRPTADQVILLKNPTRRPNPRN